MSTICAFEGFPFALWMGGIWRSGLTDVAKGCRRVLVVVAGALLNHELQLFAASLVGIIGKLLRGVPRDCV